MRKVILFLPLVLLCLACRQNSSVSADKVTPRIITEPVRYDTDDPAIWINRDNPGESLIVGTDKDADGALYVFDLQGKIDEQKTVRGLKRPNNVDIEYGLMINAESVDIAVVTERLENRIRVFRLPDMAPLDNGDLTVFDGDSLRAPMGISLYKRSSDGAIYAVVGRKEGPTDGTYLWQYLLKDNGQGGVKMRKVRAFGRYSGQKEIESIAVDDNLGFVYYSDEGVGVRKYAADPDAAEAGEELALFGQNDFTDDCEGISVYDLDDKTGYILVSDQQANKFNVYKREGAPGNPHDHQLIKSIAVSTTESDGSEVTIRILSSEFPGGLFVAMADDRRFQYYAWDDLAGDDLKSVTLSGLK